MTRSCSKCGRDISTDTANAFLCRDCQIATYGKDIHAKGRNGGLGPLPEPKAEDPLTYGQVVADLIERYCEVRTLACSPHMPTIVAAKMTADAKAELAAGLDAAFAEMIPRTIDDLV